MAAPQITNGAWSYGCMDCMGNTSVCLFGCCCQPCMHGLISDMLATSVVAEPCDMRCLNTACCCYFLLSGCSLQWCFGCAQRGAVRARFNIEGGSMEDCCCHFCCGACATCQEFQESTLRLRSGGGGGTTVVVMAPPQPQFIQQTGGYVQQPVVMMPQQPMMMQQQPMMMPQQPMMMQQQPMMMQQQPMMMGQQQMGYGQGGYVQGGYGQQQQPARSGGMGTMGTVAAVGGGVALGAGAMLLYEDPALRNEIGGGIEMAGRDVGGFAETAAVDVYDGAGDAVGAIESMF